MNVQQAYNAWAQQYDTNINATRDLEHIAIQQMLGHMQFKSGLEAGCGTGKNSGWLATKAESLTATDFSEEMLARAKEKTSALNVRFIQMDILQPWPFNEQFDLITFSLVLEHIENLHVIFKQASSHLNNGGYIYVGELHPFKQYAGSKARFETNEGVEVVECYTHHISDFVQAAKANSLDVIDVNEFFDAATDAEAPPRILALLLFKKV